MVGKDVRDMRTLDHRDVVALNFVRKDSPYIFRPHFRQGLRSHVLEVLLRSDVEREQRGFLSRGLRRFPSARPVKMLRIFRRRFSEAAQALEEIRRLRVLEAYLPPDLLAKSEEFIVDYRPDGRQQLLLCGLQEAVFGEILDPWNLPLSGAARVSADLVRHAGRFVSGAKKMILKEGLIPDIAGVGNLFATPHGRIKLVDINNVSRLPADSRIPLDDRGYPACDKSIEALARIEEHLCGASPERLAAPPYDRFLNPARMRDVRRLEEEFLESLKGGIRQPPNK
ncbi:MAG: hypothetical protein K9L59_04895 [Desulfobacterales bacterium]|nr:hypothetical protein [Desulfobacterales bacterium]